MPRNQDSIKQGPVSGKISPSATLNAQSEHQIYRVHNTGKIACPVKIGSSSPFTIGEGCSQDFGINAATTVFLGDPVDSSDPKDVEAVYELLSTPGLRSGKFIKLAGEGTKTIIHSLGKSAFYRIFNTQKNGVVSIKVGSSDAIDIAKGSSRDFFIKGAVAVTVAKKDRGIFEFLTFTAPNAELNTLVRTGHFRGQQTIVSLTDVDDLKPVYRISNSGERNIAYSGMPAAAPLKPGCSCDVEVPVGGRLALSNGDGTDEISGSYELLMINR